MQNGWLRHVFADGGYGGEKLRSALKGKGDWTIEIIKRPDKAEGFEVLSRRWVVERTFAWLNIASIRITVRRLETYCYVN